MGDADHFRVGGIEDIDVINTDEDVAHLQSRQFGWRSGLNGRNDDRSRAMNPEPKLARFSLDQDDIVALYRREEKQIETTVRWIRHY